MSTLTTWTCDLCSARVEIPGLGAPAPAHWIPVANVVVEDRPGMWRGTSEGDARVACSPACAEALAHELVTAAFARGDVSSLDVSSTRAERKTGR
jgi:hypothetical protein